MRRVSALQGHCLLYTSLLAAMSYMARGRDIQDVKAWLLVVMGRKFNDMLRKRYKQPIVSIGDDFDIVDENAMIQLNDEDDEAENVRKAVAYLAKNYREVIVRYYMNGQSVSPVSYTHLDVYKRQELSLCGY